MSLRYVILSMLSLEDMTGYEITREFDLVAGHFWKAPHQNVYRDLPKLVDAGFVTFRSVTQTDKPDKKIYSITKAGHKALADWFSTYSDPAPLRDPLLVKFFAGETVGPTVLADQLNQARSAHARKLAMFLAIEKEYYSGPIEDMPPFLALRYMTLRLGIRREQSWLEWADEAEKAIEHFRRSSTRS